MTIRLEAEYECYPLWRQTSEGLENIDPSHLKMSRELAMAIQDWDASFQRTYVADDPLRSGFASVDEEREFVRQARELAAKLTVELGEQVLLPKGSSE
jgi:hypothetical protein